MLAELLESLLMCTGALFLLVSALGLWRLEDFYQRIHAPTKAATLGMFSLFAATVVALRGWQAATNALLAILFIAVTAPVGAHYLARTAYRCGLRPKRPFERDEYGPSGSGRAGEEDGSEGP